MSSLKENVPISCAGNLSLEDIEKSGYLRKLKTMRKKFFVLRSESHAGPARLEYYDNEKKFRLGGEAKRTVPLGACFNINRKSDAKHKHAIALYTGDDCFSLVAEDEESQQEWLRALLEQQRAGGDGKSIPAFEHVWQVTVKPKGLGSSKQLSGNYRLCLTATTISLVRMNSEAGALEFSLSAIRRCGHSDCFFFMEVGRQSVTGPGELWMQVEDTVIAQSIHEASLEAMRSVRQQEEMRPRSHSSTMSSASIGAGDAKLHPSGSTSGGRRQANTLGPSWRTRCDSMPVPNRSSAGSAASLVRGSRSRGNSEGEEGQPREEPPHAIASSNSPVSSLMSHLKWCSNYIGTYFSLLKFGSKLRPRTSSEGEKGMKAPDSPTKTRGRFSIPSLSSRSSLGAGPIRPLSVHRMVAQPMSNSPPIPNSPLSESPQGYVDERYPSDAHQSDDHYFSRFGTAGRSRTPDSPSHISIREETQEANEEYMSMSPSASSKALSVPRSISHSPYHHHHQHHHLSPTHYQRRASSPALSSPSLSPSQALTLGQHHAPHLAHHHHHHHHHLQVPMPVAGGVAVHPHQHLYHNHHFTHGSTHGSSASASCASSAESSPRSLSPFVVDEPDSYMAMTPSNRSRQNSTSLAPGPSHISLPANSRIGSPSSALKPPSNEDEGYMMMGPSLGSKRATPITISPQAGSSNSEPSTYMLMNPSANRPTPSPSTETSALSWAPAPAPKSLSPRGTGGSLTNSVLGTLPGRPHRNSADHQDASLLQVGAPIHQRSHSEPVVDTYCNMEFDGRGSLGKAGENNNVEKRKSPSQRHSVPERETRYINVEYLERRGEVDSTIQVKVDAPGARNGDETSGGDGDPDGHGTTGSLLENGSVENSPMNGEYMNMSFGKGRSGSKGNMDLSQRKVPPLLVDPVASAGKDSHDYINIQTADGLDLNTKGSPLHGGGVSPTSPSWLRRPVAEQLLRPVAEQLLQRSLEELSVSQQAGLSSMGSANSLTGMGAGRGGSSNDTISPTSPAGLSSHHSSRRSSQSSLAGEKELNYIDVDIGQPTTTTHTHDISGSSTPTLREKRSRSPFRRLPNDDKVSEQVNYSTIDFTKSEGLRSVTSNLRDSRF